MAKDTNADILKEQVRFYKYEWEKAEERALYSTELKNKLQQCADHLAKVAQHFENLDPSGQLRDAVINYKRQGVLSGRPVHNEPKKKGPNAYQKPRLYPRGNVEGNL